MNIVTNWEKYAPYFKPSEFVCRCGKCTAVYIAQEFLDKLHAARLLSKTKFVIASGGRCLAHNAKVNGAAKSDHLSTPTDICTGVDIAVTTTAQRYEIETVCRSVGLNRFGHGAGFIHVGLAHRNPANVTWIY